MAIDNYFIVDCVNCKWLVLLVYYQQSSVQLQSLFTGYSARFTNWYLLMKEHTLKTHSRFFDDIWNGFKMFELRFDDRDYQVGDILYLYRYENGIKTEGKSMKAQILYILKYSDFPDGLKEGYVILQLAKIEKISLN